VREPARWARQREGYIMADSRAKLQIWTSEQRKDEFARAAQEAGMSLGEYLEHVIDAASVSDFAETHKDHASSIEVMEAHLGAIRSLMMGQIDAYDTAKDVVRQKMQARIDDALKLKDQAETQVAEAEAKAEVAEAKVADMAAKLAEAKERAAEADGLRAKLEDRDHEVTAKQMQVDDLQARLNASTDEAKGLRAQVAELQGEMAKADEETEAKVAEARDAAKAEAGEHIAEANQRVAATEEARAAADAARQAAEVAGSAAAAKVEQLKEQVEQLKEQIEQLRGDAATQGAMADKLLSQLAAKDGQMADMQADLRRVRDERKALREELAEARAAAAAKE